MKNASESYRSFEDINKTTKKRIEECNLLTSMGVLPQDSIKEVERTKEELEKEIELFKQNKKYIELWKPDNLNMYISPSDVGIHNTLRFGNTLKFLDFEYAGYDDISKQIADWVMQPNQTFSIHQEDRLLVIINNLLKEIDNTWLERYMSIKKLRLLKWSVIMYKHNNTPSVVRKYQEQASKLLDTL